MFSDTHFHFKLMKERLESSGSEILSRMVDSSCFFALDIGTKCNDLVPRQMAVEEALAGLEPSKILAACSMLYFSAGIWPDVDSIKNRSECILELERNIAAAVTGGNSFRARIAAIGECGLDHHWNEADRKNDSFDDALYEGERELFKMQIELAERLQLPVVVHSRDAFADTLECLDECGYHNGIIHCYSYGIDEARAFIDRGWHIALGGSVTYTKNSRLEQMNELLRFIPGDRLLLETDAPYLAPVPCRGQVNSPLLIAHSYEYIAGVRGCSVEDLCRTVDENCTKLFHLRKN